MGRLPLVLLTACHKLFDLEHVTSGAAGDGSMTDTATCITDTGDEDGDGIVDACDVCPTVENTGGDDDGDGLLDVCDPNLDAMMRDAIVFYVTFENAAEADAKLFETGAATVTNSNFTIDGSTTVTALTQVVPTRVELELAGFVGGNGPTATTDISMPNVECRVSNASCVGQVDGTTCLSSDGSTAQWQAAPSTARRFVIESRGGNSRCELSGPTAATAVLPSSDALVMGALSITTSSQASVIIRSIVVYGSKP